MHKFQSNYSYIYTKDLSEEDKKIHNAYGDIFYPPVGVWLTAGRDFHLRGGCGHDWDSDGVDVKKGQKFRLIYRGNPYTPAEWQVE